MNDENTNERPGDPQPADSPSGAPQPSGSPSGEEPTHVTPRRFVRSSSDRVLGGVAGGLGRYFNVDPIFFRIGFAALTFFGGIGFFLYLAGWIFVPDENGRHAFQRAGRHSLLAVIGVIALAIAAFAILDEAAHGGWGFGWWWWGGFFGPLLLIGLAGALVWRLAERRRQNTAVAPGAQAEQPRADAGFIIGRIVLVVAILTGAAILFVGAALAAAAGGGAAIAGIVIAIGLLLVFAAFRGGARWLVFPALLLAIPVGVVSAADFDLDGGVGDREYRPTTVSEIRDRYELGIGSLEIDLRDVQLPKADQRLKVGLGVGEAVLVVPEGVCVTADSRIGAGYARVFDRDSQGLDVEWDVGPTVGPPAVPHLVVDADIGIGALQIVHDPGDAERGRERGFLEDGDLNGAGNACEPLAVGRDARP